MVAAQVTYTLWSARARVPVIELWIALGVGELLKIFCTRLPCYPTRRAQIMLALRLVVSGVIFWTVRESIQTQSAPTFAAAAFHALYGLARIKFPLFFSLLYQIPLDHGQIVLQTALVAYLILQGREECSLMISANKDFAKFARSLEQNCRLWETEGSAMACHDLCDNLLDTSGSLCTWVCPVTLPVVWMVYGSPWSRACVIYRWVSGAVIRYVLPLLGLYIAEVVERREFAKSKGFTVPDLLACLRLGWRHFQKEVFKSLLTVLVCFNGF
eukprot:jgi/Botrbrau1/17422/Bobra.0054s0018.2